MADLVSPSDEAAILVVGRKAVALLGQTGTGKSTFIYLVAGPRLKKDQVATWCTSTHPVANDGKSTFSKDHLLSANTVVALIMFGIHLLGLLPFSPPLHPVLECLVSRGCEDTRGTEIDIATCSRSWPIVATASGFDVLVSVVAVKTLRGEFLGRLLTMVTTFVKGFHANRCAFTFFFTHTNELTQMHGKDLAGIKVELKELLMDIRREHGEKQRGADSGFEGALFGGGAAFRGHLPPRAL